MSKPIILLPSTLHILRERPTRSAPSDRSEYSLYFSNIINPFRPEWDVRVHCAYGGNLGNCWRIADPFPRNVDEFPLTVEVFDEEGHSLTAKTVTVRLYDRLPHKEPFHTLFFGDSMTHLGHYVTHAVTRLYNIKTEGTRSFNDLIRIEGRGGWAMKTYFNKVAADRSAPSPFLFPDGIPGEDYFGDMGFYDAVQDPDHDPYGFDGYRMEPCRPGQYYLREGRLYQKAEEGDRLVNEAPTFSFDFDKYVRRNGIKQLDAVSVLMGANDLQRVPYEKSEATVEQYIADLKRLIKAVRTYDERVKILINMPVLGSEQYHWGIRVKGSPTSKQYRHNILRAAGRMLEEFDDREGEGLYLCPMVAVLDPEHGFDRLTAHPHIHSEALVEHQANWVHPNRPGYLQMGDALAAVLEAVRQFK